MTRSGPLDGIRVLDFSRVLAGPHCGRMLVDLGADVIKIEPPTGDLTRVFQPRVNSLSVYHVQQNCGKRNVSIDLSRTEGVELARRLTEHADVVLENFRPGVMARMGLGYDEVAASNPRVVYGSISGFGQGGPWANRRAYARIIHAEMGLMLGVAERNGTAPVHDEYSHADVYTALECLAGILAALFQRERTGHGQHVEVAMAETMLCVNEHVATDLLVGEAEAAAVTSAGRGRDPVFRTADGPWVTVAGNPALNEFAMFCSAIDREDLVDDPRFATAASRNAHRNELIGIIQDAVLQMGSVENIEAVFGKQRLATGVLHSLEEAASSDWAVSRGAVVEVSDRGGGTIRIPNSPWRFSAADTGVKGEPAYRGEHNREVLAEVLGLDERALGQLEEAGIVSSRGPRRSPSVEA